MDWISDFTSKYKDDVDLNSLADRKYHGYLQINFQNGQVMNCNLYQSKSYTVATPNSFTYVSHEGRVSKTPTLKKGGN